MKYFYTLRSNRMLIGIIQKVLMHSSRKPEIIIYLFYRYLQTINSSHMENQMHQMYNRNMEWIAYAFCPI